MKKKTQGHSWTDINENALGGKPKDGVSVRICTITGARCELDKDGKVVDYDRLWNFGDPIPVDADVEWRKKRDAKRAA